MNSSIISSPKCPKCGAEMLEGYVRQTGFLSEPVAAWVQGRTLHGLLRRIQEGQRDLRRIQTYRCISCGFLESFAREPAR